MTDKYTALRNALAAGPTPGPWRIGTPPPNGEQTIGTRQGLMLAVATTGIGMEAETLSNATYIAAASPEVIAALLAERDRLRAALELFATYEREMASGDDVAAMLTYAQLKDAATSALAMGEGNE